MSESLGGRVGSKASVEVGSFFLHRVQQPESHVVLGETSQVSGKHSPVGRPVFTLGSAVLWPGPATPSRPRLPLPCPGTAVWGAQRGCWWELGSALLGPTSVSSTHYCVLICARHTLPASRA